MKLIAQILVSGIPGLTIVQALPILFLALTFLETGLNKLIDYQGNLAYFKDHFKNSPLAKGELETVTCLSICCS